MNVIEKLNRLRIERGWSVNNLAMEAGLTQSTLGSMLSRNTPPKIETLQCLCEALGITMAQFFLEDEQVEILSESERELLIAFRKLPETKKKALLEFINE